jgi:pentatricopeptide repeat protein
MSRKSLVTWNSMISACANNRNPEDAFGLFSRMFNYGVAPDGVTFLAVLTAYAHVGLVDEGYRLFESMQRDHGIEARIEHYGCVVNMLGQAGWLEEAFELITACHYQVTLFGEFCLQPVENMAMCIWGRGL